MKNYQPIIFPHIQNKSWGLVNLDEYALAEFEFYEKNPLIDAAYCDEWVLNIAKNNGYDFTYGGFLEDRRNLWRQSYLTNENAIHLGIDYNVPVKTIVTIPENGIVVDVFKDTNTNGGWGGRLIVELSNATYLLYGHLHHDSLPEVGELFSAEQEIAETGYVSENGNWFPHLHVQYFNKHFYETFLHDLTLLDGYDSIKSPLINDVLDPTLLVGKCD